MPTPSRAFSLLGPYAPWMTPELGYQLPGDLGGPMNLGEGYRWNIPLVTYGFDSGFLNFFGSNGVAAVEEAISLLNSLPPAADIVVSGAPTIPFLVVNTSAASLQHYDLKSRALTSLLQCLGLAESSRYIYTLRDRTVIGTTTNFSVIQRHFNPITLIPTNVVNGVLYTYITATDRISGPGTNRYADAVESRVSGHFQARGAAGAEMYAGDALGSLTADDLGGLKYLLRYSNIVQEELLPDVRGAGPNATNWIGTALRPGVEKVTLVRQPAVPGTGAFLPMTNRYTDAYFDGAQLRRQELERVTTQPDILFSGRDLGTLNTIPVFTAAGGVTNWLNLASLNGQPGAAGPGIIRPPMTVAFSTVGFYYYNFAGPGGRFLDERSAVRGQTWASFTTVNTTAVYPQPPTDGAPTKLRLDFTVGAAVRQASWNLYGPPGARYFLQHSVDLRNWTNSVTVTNTGLPLTYILPVDPAIRNTFYRALPE